MGNKKAGFVLIIIIVIVLLFVICFSISYISITNKSNVAKEQQISNINRKITKNDLIKFMQDKYDDKFTYIDSFDGGLNRNQKYIIVSSERLGDKEINVLYEKTNEIETYKDNYTEIKFEKETYELIKETLSKVFNKEVLIIHNTLASENNFNSKTTFKEFLKSDESGIRFYAVVSPDYKIKNLKKLKEELKEKFAKNFASCYAEIYFAGTKDEFLPFYNIPYWKKDNMKKIVIEL